MINPWPASLWFFFPRVFLRECRNGTLGPGRFHSHILSPTPSRSEPTMSKCHKYNSIYFLQRIDLDNDFGNLVVLLLLLQVQNENSLQLY